MKALNGKVKPAFMTSAFFLHVAVGEGLNYKLLPSQSTTVPSFEIKEKTKTNLCFVFSNEKALPSLLSL